MIRPLGLGLLSGIVISAALLWDQFLLPSPEFGQIPLILAVFLTVALVTGLRKISEINIIASRGRWLLAAIASVIPAIFFLFPMTGYFSFIGQGATAGNFIFLFLLYLLIVGIPLIILTILIRSGRDNMDYGLLLVATGAGIFLHQMLATALPLDISLLLPCLAALTPLVPVTGKEQQSAASVANDSKPSKKQKKIPADLPVIYFIAGLLAILLIPKWVLLAIEHSRYFLLGTDSAFMYLYPACIAVFGIGLILSKKVSEQWRILALVISMTILALSVVGGSFRWQESLFPDLYSAYYTRISFSVLLGEWMLWIAIIPLLSAGFLFGTVRRATSDPAEKWQIEPYWIFFAGLSYAIWSPDSVLAIGTTSGILCLWLLGKHTQYRLYLRIPLTLAVGVLILVPTWKLPEMEFESLFDPTTYKVISEEFGRSGQTTLLRSRDYDDAFYMVYWNQVMPITMATKDLRPNIQRTAHLPMLLHSNPKDVLVLGMGAFEKYPALALYEPENLTVVDPNPAMFRLFNQWLEAEQEDEPLNMSLHAERLPAFVARNSEHFDVIISSDPFAFPFHQQGSFTIEYYNSIRESLKDKGLFVQWIPLDGVPDNTVHAMVTAIVEAFPHTEAWTGTWHPGSAALGIVASSSPIAIRNGFRGKLAEFLEDDWLTYDFQVNGLPSWEYLASEYAGGRDFLKRFAKNATPIATLTRDVLYNPREPAENAGELFTDVLQSRTFNNTMLTAGTADSSAQLVESLFRSRFGVYSNALQLLAVTDTNAIHSLINIIQAEPKNIEAKTVLADAFIREAAQRVSQGNYQAAFPGLLQAVGLIPLNTYVLRLLLLSSLSLGDAGTAQMSLDGIKRLNPKHAGAKDNQATIKAQGGDVQDALLLYEHAITMDPTNENFYCNMAALQFNGGRAWEAVRILDNAIDKSYYPAKAHFLMGVVYDNGGKKDLALEAYQKYLATSKPNDENREAALESIKKIETDNPL